MDIPGHIELLKQQSLYKREVMESRVLVKDPSAKEKAMDQVRRAYELLIRLDFLMSFMNLEGSRSELAFALLHELLESFTTAMSMLNTRQNVSSKVRDSSQQPTKESIPCFKRIKLEKSQDVNLQTNRKEKFVEKKISCAPYNDGHQWLKYGEKKILNSIYPRCYYKCTYHDSELKCPTKKQVQQDDHDPSLYHVTYQGKHTCNAAATPKLIANTTLQDEPASVGYAAITNLYDERITRSSCESVDSNNSLPELHQIDSMSAKEQSAEGSDGVDNSTSDWPLDSFDIEYGELVFVPSYLRKIYVGERCEEISPQLAVTKLSDCSS